MFGVQERRRIGVKPLFSIVTEQNFDNRRRSAWKDPNNLPNEDEARQDEQVPAQPAPNETTVRTPAAGVWNFGVSVNPPQRAAPLLLPHRK